MSNTLWVLPVWRLIKAGFRFPDSTLITECGVVRYLHKCVKHRFLNRTVGLVRIAEVCAHVLTCLIRYRANRWICCWWCLKHISWWFVRGGKQTVRCSVSDALINAAGAHREGLCLISNISTSPRINRKLNASGFHVLMLFALTSINLWGLCAVPLSLSVLFQWFVYW